MSRSLCPDSNVFRLLILSTFVAASGHALAQQRPTHVAVERVVDGETLVVSTIGRVKLLGIDAPKFDVRISKPDDPGRLAQQRLEGLLTGRWVRLEYERDARATTKSAYVFLDDGRFVNAWLARQGLVRVSVRGAVTHRRELEVAQDEARAAHRGLWRDAP